MMPAWRVNPQPSTRPSAGSVSPDPERHHPDLGAARRPTPQPTPLPVLPQPGDNSPIHRHPQAGEFDPSRPINLLTQGLPDSLLSARPESPQPMIDMQAHGSLTPPGPHGGVVDARYRQATPGPAYPAQPRGQMPGQAYMQPPAQQGAWPLSHSIPLAPLDRVDMRNQFVPQFPPQRPHSPSGAYLPGPNAEPRVEARHLEMIDHNFATFAHHPAMPAGPAGQIQLGRAHAEALTGFRQQVWANGDLTREYAQSYRVDNGRFMPVHPQLVPGHVNEVAMPSGSYPPGTGLVIHSHAINSANRYPTESDMLRAYADRTNVLQHPESRVASHILYDPSSDRAYMYDGTLDAHGNPHYFLAVVPPQSTLPLRSPRPPTPPPMQIAQPAPRTAEQIQVPAWLNANTPTGSPAPRSPQRPDSSASAQRNASGAQSPYWDEWMDFSGGGKQ